MNDDETGEVIKRTDLAHETPNDRAAWSPHFVEKSEIEASKHGLKLKSESAPGSSQNKAQSTLYLLLGLAAVTLVATWIGIPAAGALATGAGATIAFYLLVHVTSGPRKR